MASFKRIAEKILGLIEKPDLRLGIFTISFASLIVARLIIEGAISRFQSHSFAYFFSEFSHTFLFFSLAFSVLLAVLLPLARKSVPETASVLLFGFLIILSPPIIDKLIFGDSNAGKAIDGGK